MSEDVALLLLTDQPALRLRLLRETDAGELFALTDRNRGWLRSWLPWLDSITSVADSLSFIQIMRGHYANEHRFACGLFFKGQLAGVAGPNVIDHANRACQIGYWLGENHTGRGLMTSAVRALVSHAFTSMQLNRVEIRAATGNHASQAVCERLGFIREGVVRDAEWLYDHYVDLTINSLLRREWTSLHNEPDSP